MFEAAKSAYIYHYMPSLFFKCFLLKSTILQRTDYNCRNTNANDFFGEHLYSFRETNIFPLGLNTQSIFLFSCELAKSPLAFLYAWEAQNFLRKKYFAIETASGIIQYSSFKGTVTRDGFDFDLNRGRCQF